MRRCGWTSQAVRTATRGPPRRCSTVHGAEGLAPANSAAALEELAKWLTVLDQLLADELTAISQYWKYDRRVTIDPLRWPPHAHVMILRPG